MKQLLVAARSGQKCPLQNGGYITETPVAVPANRYYLRLVAEGSIDEVAEKKPAQKPVQKNEKPTKRQEAVNDDSK